MEFMYLVFFQISLKIWIQKNWPKQQTPVTFQDYVACPVYRQPFGQHLASSWH